MRTARGYRLWQGFTPRLNLWPGRIDSGRAQVLPAAWSLFESLNRADQVHALCVLRHVEHAPDVSAALAQAALLHDAGKADAGLSLFWRTIGVLLDLDGACRLSQSALLEYPLYRQLCHAEYGAELCSRAGCAPEVVALVRWHDSARFVAGGCVSG